MALYSINMINNTWIKLLYHAVDLIISALIITISTVHSMVKLVLSWIDDIIE